MQVFSISEQKPGTHFSPGPTMYNQAIQKGDVSAALGIFKPRRSVDENAVMVALKVKLNAITSQENLSHQEIAFFTGELTKYEDHLSADFLQLIEQYFSRNNLQPCIAVINEIRLAHNM